MSTDIESMGYRIPPPIHLKFGITTCTQRDGSEKRAFIREGAAQREEPRLIVVVILMTPPRMDRTHNRGRGRRSSNKGIASPLGGGGGGAGREFMTII
ncbi:hypothetical protein CDAR_442681 [Caerostris darwini]|uniref:Uncharacterized protein n=1 Tax=Caerostris darwini TaxID=1538125 RepID=A0AAV4VNY8_9ARAC|nr:hypothetical protein CDAR_442681 [Caerostris darwini]